MNSFDRSDRERNAYKLWGKLEYRGYDCWRHVFTGVSQSTGEEKTFFAEYLICNPMLGGEDPVLGQAPENKEYDFWPSYLMVKAGCYGRNAVQIHRFFGYEQIRVYGEKFFRIIAGDCRASETEIRGSVSVTPEEVEEYPEYLCGAGEMSWRLQVQKEIPFHAGGRPGNLMQEWNALEMFWHAEGIKTFYEGEVVFDGEIFKVSPDTCRGYADKIWGSGFASPLIRLSGNDIVRKRDGKRLKNSAFVVEGGQQKVFGIPVRGIRFGGFYLEGSTVEFNCLKPWTGAGTRFVCRKTKKEVIWHTEQENLDYVMRVNLHCRRSDLLRKQYETPDGKLPYGKLLSGADGYGWIRLYRKEKGAIHLIGEFRVRHAICEFGE